MRASLRGVLLGLAVLFTGLFIEELNELRVAARRLTRLDVGQAEKARSPTGLRANLRGAPSPPPPPPSSPEARREPAASGTRNDARGPGGEDDDRVGEPPPPSAGGGADDVLGFDARERAAQAGAAADAVGGDEWLDDWRCIGDATHRGWLPEDSPFNADGHCSMAESALPAWYSRDIHVEAMMLRDPLVAPPVDGFDLAASLRGKLVYVFGDSIIRQMFEAWRCDLRRMFGGASEVVGNSPSERARRETFRAFVEARHPFCDGGSAVYVASSAMDEAVGRRRRGGGVEGVAAAGEVSGEKEGSGHGGEGGGGTASEDSTAGDVTMVWCEHTRLRSLVEKENLAELLGRVDVVFGHVGLHYPPGVSPEMRADFDDVLPVLNDFAGRPGRAALMLEIGAQHFPDENSSGWYEDRTPTAENEACTCAPVHAVGGGRLGPPRVDRNVLLEEAGARYEHVRVVPFRKLTVPRFAGHFKSRHFRAMGDTKNCDCTHWCYSALFWRAVFGGAMNALVSSL